MTGFCHISSGLFKHIKFHRTLSKRMIFVLHWILLPSYHVLPHPTTPNHILPCLTSVDPILRVVYCHPTLEPTPSYLILPHLTTSYPGAPPYPILQCILLPSYLTSNPGLLYPTPYNHILPRPTRESFASLPCPTSSYILPCPTKNVCNRSRLLPPYHILPGRTQPIPSNNILPRPKLDSPAMLPRPTSPYPVLPILPLPTLSVRMR